MSKTMTALCLACCLVILPPAFADYSDLQASATGVSGHTVTVSVYNPTASPVSARVRVAVQLDDESFFLLTSATFTVAALSTSVISLSAPSPVAEIEDNPEPF